MQNLVKFGLPLNKTKVYYLEQLRQNFVLHEIVELYQTGLLQHWLKFRGYTAELEQLTACHGLPPEKLQQALVEVFKLDASRFVVAQASPLEGYSKVEIGFLLINRLSTRYSALLAKVLSHPYAMSELKQEVATLVNEYGVFLEMDPLTFKLVQARPLIFLLILTHRKGWSIFHLDGTSTDNLETLKPKLNIDSEVMVGSTLLEYIDQHFEEHFGSYFNPMTLEGGHNHVGEGWDNLFAQGSRFLVWVKDGSSVAQIRSAGDQDLSRTLACSHLFLVDGIDYRCQDKKALIYYMSLP